MNNELPTPSSVFEPSRVLAADAYEICGFADSPDKIKTLDAPAGPLSEIIQHLLFYDEVVVAAENLLFLVPMFRRYGAAHIEELLRSRRLRIAFVRGTPVVGRPSEAEAGQAGLFVTSSYTRDRQVKTSGLSPTQECERLIHTCRKHQIPCVSESAILDSHFDWDLEKESQEVCTRSAAVIRGSESIRLWTGSHLDENGEVVFPTCAPRTIRVNSIDSGDEPLLRLHSVHQLVCLQRLLAVTQSRDFSLSSMVHQAALLSSWKSANVVPSQSSVCEIAEVPYIGQYVWHNPNRMKNLVRLISSSSAKSFRNWFQSNCAGRDTVQVARECRILFERDGVWNFIPVKIMRFVFTSMLDGGLGLIVGAVDNVGVDAVTSLTGSKAFIRRARQFVIDKE